LTKNNDQLCGLSNGLKDVLKKYVTKDKKRPLRQIFYGAQ
jgi:hypothetical protein